MRFDAQTELAALQSGGPPERSLTKTQKRNKRRYRKLRGIKKPPAPFVQRKEGPELPPLIPGSHGRMLCTRPHIYQVGWTRGPLSYRMASPKVAYTFLQVIRASRGGCYYLCPNGGEHWHRTRSVGEGSFPVPVQK